MSGRTGWPRTWLSAPIPPPPGQALYNATLAPCVVLFAALRQNCTILPLRGLVFPRPDRQGLVGRMKKLRPCVFLGGVLSGCLGMWRGGHLCDLGI